MSMLNPNQIRHVVATFAHVDSLLQAVERVTRTGLSPFAPEQPDIADDEARLLQSFIAIARARMLGALDRLGIARPVPNLSARWSVDTSLNLSEISLIDLDGEHLKGYGAVDEAAASELAAFAADLRGVIRRARHVLHERDPGGLAAALGAVPGPVGEILREIDRLSRDHALAGIRPLLAAAVERATGGTFDVGVFGRVSAGKSWLINALVGADVLPVGATPVTAVPTRLTRGAAGAIVHLLDGASHNISLDRIAEYATEERNPENRAGVRAIEAATPSVPDGLRLLDTPGVGSLSTSGPALAFQWLPRCDLGLVLITAGSAVARDDLALVTGLYRAGIGCVVLLSKADLLSGGDIDAAIAYAQHALSAALGGKVMVDVRAISIAPGAESRFVEFRRDVLAPLAHDHARAAERALIARVHRLIHATAGALAGRRGETDDRGLGMQRARTDAMSAVRREIDRVDAAGPAILEVAAASVAAAWQGGEDARTVARHTIVHAAADALGAITSAIEPVRALAGVTGTDSRRVPPLFDPDFLDALPALPPPPLAKRLVGHAMAVRRLEPIARPLAEALQRYASRLYAWGTGALEELGAASWDTDPEMLRTLPPELERLERMLDGLAVAASPSTSAADR
jgi:hypothetical protein